MERERKEKKENNRNNRLHKSTIDLFDVVHSPYDTHNHIFMLIDFVIAEGDTHTQTRCRIEVFTYFWGDFYVF